MKDLTNDSPGTIAAERSRVATEGWGAQLLARQSSAGHCGDGSRGWRSDLPKDDRALLIALYALVVLKDFGVEPASKQALKMIDRVDQRLVSKRLDNRRFLHGETEPCINGESRRKSAAVTKARNRGENYLLKRGMFRSLQTGEVIDKRWFRFSFPPFWHYDVLRGLDYLRNTDQRFQDPGVSLG